MTNEPTLLLCLDLAGTFTFALNGGLTAVRGARLDIVGVVTLAMVSGLGGGIIRDVLLGALPPATFSDWRYLAVAAGGGLVAFAVSGRLARLTMLLTVLDAAGRPDARRPLRPERPHAPRPAPSGPAGAEAGRAPQPARPGRARLILIWPGFGWPVTITVTSGRAGPAGAAA